MAEQDGEVIQVRTHESCVTPRGLVEVLPLQRKPFSGSLVYRCLQSAVAIVEGMGKSNADMHTTTSFIAIIQVCP